MEFFSYNFICIVYMMILIFYVFPLIVSKEICKNLSIVDESLPKLNTLLQNLVVLIIYAFDNV